MSKVKLEIVISDPVCTTSLVTSRNIKRMIKEFEGKIDFDEYSFRDPKAEKYRDLAMPLVFLNGKLINEPGKKPKNKEMKQLIKEALEGK